MDEPVRQYLRVPVGEGAAMFIPNPKADPHLCWSLRYVATQKNYVAASVVDSFEYMLSDNISMKEATRRLRLMRKARRDVALIQEPQRTEGV